MFPGLASFFFWIKGIAIIGANRAGVFLHLMPVFGSIMAIILFLFMLDDYDERKEFFKLITFNDKFLENRLSELCGFDEEGMSVDELNALWNLKSE